MTKLQQPGRPPLAGVRRAAARLVFPGRDKAVRRRVMNETIAYFEGSGDRSHQIAARNLAAWHQAAAPPREELVLEVHAGDWGDVALALTRRYGRVFAVLNMAHPRVPGGAYLEGAVAQEENLFRRTDCHFHVTADDYDARRNRYRLKMQRLVTARDGEVYLDVDQPRVCVRGPEDRGHQDLGYRWLDQDDIFLFYELRAAAVRRFPWQRFNEGEMRRRIAAQLDTLATKGIRHAVLGAFGCGAFGNPADRVAGLYREEIARRTRSFDVLAFAIYDAGYGPDNGVPFYECFTVGQ
ncbi:hypothetical protein JCM18899A_52030 [Nocardioides sp. AN3]